MKTILTALSICFCQTLFAQPKAISVSTNKTVSLVFSSAIVHVDRGTQYVLVQQAQGSGNVLLLKAGSPDFDETNLSVITKNGDVYAFVVRPAISVDTLIYHLAPQDHFDINDYARSLLNLDTRRFAIQDHKYEMYCRVTGIFIKDDVIFFKMIIDNKSPIAFDIDVLRFGVKNRKKTKRTAVQEFPLSPIYVAGNQSRVPAFTKSALVLAFDKLTLPDGKYLEIQLMEEGGGRHLHLKIHNRHLIRATTLPDIN